MTPPKKKESKGSFWNKPITILLLGVLLIPGSVFAVRGYKDAVLWIDNITERTEEHRSSLAAQSDSIKAQRTDIDSNAGEILLLKIGTQAAEESLEISRVLYELETGEEWEDR